MRFSTTLLAACTLLLSACAAPTAEERDEIIVLNSSEVRTLMQKMAVMVFNLEDLVLAPNTADPGARQEAVIGQLAEIEKVAMNLGAGPQRTNHFLIDSGIDRLVTDLHLASDAASAEPPDYEPALDVIDQCKRCHLMR